MQHPSHWIAWRHDYPSRLVELGKPDRATARSRIAQRLSGHSTFQSVSSARSAQSGATNARAASPTVVGAAVYAFKSSRNRRR